MGVHTLLDRNPETAVSRACMICSTTDVAFGPVVQGDWHDHTYEPDQVLEVFIHWMDRMGLPVRALADVDLAARWQEFRDLAEDDLEEFEKIILTGGPALAHLKALCTYEQCDGCAELFTPDAVYLDGYCSICSDAAC